MERNNNEQVKTIWKPLCFVFAVLLALSWVFFGFLYSNGNVSFSTLENPEQEQTDSGGMIIGEGESNGVKLMSAKIAPEDFAANDVSTLAESAYKLTASVYPSTATDKTVDWSVEFVNPSSAWATGKAVTDYVTVTPTSDGALTANVECLQAFGEQIKVIVTSRDNSSAKANCTVDYMKRIKSLNFTFKYGDVDKGSISADTDGVYRFDYTGEKENYTVIPSPVYLPYTIDVDYTLAVSGTFTDAFGYGDGVMLNSLFLGAGLSGAVSEGELSSAANAYVEQIGSCVQIWQINGLMAAEATATTYYNALSATDKQHSRVENAREAHLIIQSILSAGRMDNDKMAQARDLYNNYQAPSPSGEFMGVVTVPSADALLQAAKACNDAKKGIVEYTITYSSGDITYRTTYEFGYTVSSVNAVRRVNVSPSSVIV